MNKYDIGFKYHIQIPPCKENKASGVLGCPKRMLPTGQGRSAISFIQRSEVTAGLLSPDLDSPVQNRHGKESTGDSSKRHEDVERLEDLLYEERRRDLGMFIL